MSDKKKALETSIRCPVTSEDIFKETIAELQDVYFKKIAPLEKAYSFEGFHSEPLTPKDIEAAPMVLLIGQYSTGKTTFIEYILGEEYPGSYIGIEPTTDKFTAVMSGASSKIIPGHAAAVSGDLPFTGLQKFGTKFLSRFQVSHMNKSVLQNITIIDSPGILSGAKQMDRGYDFTKAVQWFAERADLILILFDGYKLDISDEFRVVITSLRGLEDKTRIVLNKCDQIDQQQLMRVYGALMWSLGKIVATPEVIRVYLGSFWPSSKPPLKIKFGDSTDLLKKEQNDLMDCLRQIPKNAAIRRVNDMVKRTRQAKVHAYIISHLKNEMPAVFGKTKKAQKLLNNLKEEFVKIQQLNGLSPGDFPNPLVFREILENYDISKFKKLDKRLLSNVEAALSKDFPRLMQNFPNSYAEDSFPWSQKENGEDHLHSQATTSASHRPMPPRPPPRYTGSGSSSPDTQGASNPVGPSTLHYLELFNKHCDSKTRLISAKIASELMEGVGLFKEDLKDIWFIADAEDRGSLDSVQFEVAMRLCYMVKSGIDLKLAKEKVYNDLGLDL
ncbi:EH domain-containing protein 1 [Zancudomyces culisetae]|uniref:EH domain-containing protein 1 n=1 Tax=Zancudomyces culisetae TaxID=1213189 RepID=A0A1R1PJ78_ZANCU|nr:EH domain-containing protein 1 [Zancudomyces culisetae]|eukprot:OMH81055.1 EH domain-containing protein 1 [Zancudomyces culisetae]